MFNNYNQPKNKVMHSTIRTLPYQYTNHGFINRGKIVQEVVQDPQFHQIEPLGAPYRPLYPVGNKYTNSGQI